MAEPSGSERPCVSLEIDEGIKGLAILTLHNPSKRNALTLPMCDDIVRACAQVGADQQIGALVVRGADDFFCSGADTTILVEAARNPASEEAVSTISQIYQAIRQVAELEVVTAAQVAGGAVGAGLNLALACDLLVTEPQARLSSGFTRRGLHPGGGHFALLAKNASYQTALAMAVGGLDVSGERAVELGLAWATAETAALGQVARSLLRHAADDPALARRVKTSARAHLSGVSLSTAIELERGAQMWSFARLPAR